MSFLVECIGFVASAFMTGFVAGRWSKRFENAQNRETIMQTCDTLEQDAKKRPLPTGGVIFGNRSPRLSVKYKGSLIMTCGEVNFFPRSLGK